MYDKDAHFNIVVQWNKDNKEKDLNITYNINNTSVVFDVGTYKGDWAEQIFNKYNCSIYCFEPIKEFYENICNRFKSNKKIHVFNYAVGGKTRKDKIIFLKDGSSLYQMGNKKLDILVKSVDNVLNDLNLSMIDVIKLNVEGAEYEILDHMILTGDIKKFNNLFIQFHREVHNYEQRRNNIIFNLNKTHERVFNYEMVWERWVKKS
jgi:FkbM family methyltransferase